MLRQVNALPSDAYLEPLATPSPRGVKATPPFLHWDFGLCFDLLIRLWVQRKINSDDVGSDSVYWKLKK